MLRSAVAAEFAKRYPVQVAGAAKQQKLWVRAEELAEFNRQLVGRIEVVVELKVESKPTT